LAQKAGEEAAQKAASFIDSDLSIQFVTQVASLVMTE
jgi:hypothetical protein